MQVGTCIAERGELKTGSLDVAKLADGTNLRIPVKVARGNHDGKTAFLSAGIHGNEINGLAVLHRFLSELNIQDLTGTLMFLPCLNPWGFEKRVRYLPFDGKDLNRCFPGDAQGSPAERIARTIHEEITSRCDFGIDLHDAGSRTVLLPHPRVHLYETDGCTKEMGSALGTEIILERLGRKGMMAIEAHRHHGIPVITAEIGGGMVLWEGFIKEGIVGVRNILRYQGMLPGDPIVPRKQFYLSMREGYRADVSGLLERRVELGQGVRRGQLLARIYDPVGDTHHDIHSQHGGVIFSVRLGGTIEAGEMALSILEFQGGDREPIPRGAEVITNEGRSGREVRDSKLLTAAKSIMGRSTIS